MSGMNRDSSLISVVIPVYNERQNLDELRRRVEGALRGRAENYEVILVDNCSTDGTREKIAEFTRQDPHWKGIWLSRNFGHQNSLFCGLEHASGEAIISLDGDLQDPPEIIPQLLEKWQNGADVINTVRLKRPGEPWWRIALIHLFYKIMTVFSGGLIPYNSGDYRLLSRRALDQLRRMPDRTLFIRGLVPLLGFRQEIQPYLREIRGGGSSKMGFFRLFSFAIDGLINTTVIPLRLATAVGFFSLLFSLIYGLRIFILYFTSEEKIPGWTSIILLITSYGGLILMTLGILGEYLGRVFHEVKQRPKYIVDQYIGSVLRGP